MAVTPSTLFSRFSMRFAHEAQVMPVMSSSMRFGAWVSSIEPAREVPLAFVVLSDVVSVTSAPVVVHLHLGAAAAVRRAGTIVERADGRPHAQRRTEHEDQHRGERAEAEGDAHDASS